MDTPLSGERIPEEKAYASRYIDNLSSRPVNYPADYAPSPEERPRKVAVVGAPVVAPPDMDVDEVVQDAKINVTVKSLKPPLTFTLSASLSDSVSDLKAAVTGAGGPAVDSQRLLLKGKALADSKLLKEYDLADGAVIHLMVKPGSIKTTLSPAPVSLAPRSPTRADAPHLTITTPVEGATPAEIPDGLDFDRSECASPIASKAFHDTASSVEFWLKLHQLCHSEFANDDDADTVFDTFLVAMKSRLTASESAKIRDVVGVAGMGGGA